MKDFLPLFLSLSKRQDLIQFIFILVLAYFLKPIKHGYPNLVILTIPKIRLYFSKFIRLNNIYLIYLLLIIIYKGFIHF